MIGGGGVPAPSPPAPSYWLAAASGTWGVLPSANTLLSIDPEADFNLNPNHPGQAPWHGTSGISEVFNAWSGGCWDAAGNFYSDIAGGHAGLALNARFKFAAGQAAPSWSLRGTFSGAKGTPAVNYSDAVTLPTSVYPDGAPRATHTWNAPVFAPGIGSILAGLSGRYYDGDFGPRWAVKFDATTGAATYSAVPAVGSGSSSTIAACFDPTRGASGSVWRRWGGTSMLQRLDLAADVWVAVGAAQAWAGECSLTYLDGHDCILIGNGSAQTGQAVTGGWCVVDCATGVYYFPTFTGAPALGVAGPGGFWPGNTQPRWSQARGKVYAWGNTSQTTSVTTLTPGANPRTDPWTVGAIAVSPSNTVTPTAARPNGTYGRFGIWESAGVLLLLNEHNTPGYFFKL